MIFGVERETVLAVVAVLALVPTFFGVLVIPFGRWVAGRWRAVRDAERDLRHAAEAELLEERKRCAILELKLKYCESELERGR